MLKLLYKCTHFNMPAKCSKSINSLSFSCRLICCLLPGQTLVLAHTGDLDKESVNGRREGRSQMVQEPGPSSCTDSDYPQSFSLVYELISQDFSPIFLPLSFPFYSTNKYILSISCIQTKWNKMAASYGRDLILRSWPVQGVPAVQTEKTGSVKKSDSIGSPPTAQHMANRISGTDSKRGRFQTEGDDYVLMCFNFILS